MTTITKGARVALKADPSIHGEVLEEIDSDGDIYVKFYDKAMGSNESPRMAHCTYRKSFELEVIVPPIGPELVGKTIGYRYNKNQRLTYCKVLAVFENDYGVTIVALSDASQIQLSVKLRMAAKLQIVEVRD